MLISIYWLQSPTAEGASATVLESENVELMRKVAMLQKSNSELQERVDHLETSSASMAEDIMGKTAIIEHYIMNGRIGIFSCFVYIV